MSKIKKSILTIGLTTCLATLLWFLLVIVATPVIIVKPSYLTISRFISQSSEMSWLYADRNLSSFNLAENFPYIFAIFVLLGSISLWISLKHVGQKWVLPAIIFLASCAAFVTQAFQLSSTAWLLIFIVPSFIFMIIKMMDKNKTPTSPEVNSKSFLQIYLIFGLWLFLICIGAIWITDVALRGPEGLKSYGLKQIDGIWFCVMLALPLGVIYGDKWTSYLLNINSSTYSFRNFIISFVAVAIFCLFNYCITTLPKKPHLSAELIRISSSILIAWFMARYYEWGSHSKKKSNVIVILLIGAALIGVLLVTKDLGPVLVTSCALIPVILIFLFRKNTNIKQYSFLILGWILAIIAIYYCLMVVLPAQTWAPERMIERTESIEKNSIALNNYYQQILWIREAATPDGFGLGSVPWCGSNALVGLEKCTRYSGVPVQFTEDFVYTGLVVAFGESGAVLLLALSVLLLLLVIFNTAKFSKKIGFELTATRIRSWIVSIYAAMLLGQVLVGVAGNIGFIQLTGVTLPFFSTGNVSLIATAIWLGYAFSGMREASIHQKWLSNTFYRYFSAVLTGVILFIFCNYFFPSFNKKNIDDKHTPIAIENGLAILNKQKILSDINLDTSLYFSQQKNVSIDSNCRIKADSINNKLIQIFKVTKIAFELEYLNCESAENVQAALVWIKRSLNIDAKVKNFPKVNVEDQILLASYLKSPKSLNLSKANPYRIEGCIQLSQQSQLGQDVLENKQQCLKNSDVLANEFLSQAPRLKNSLTSLVTRIRSKAKNNSSNEFDLNQETKNEFASPAWAKIIYLDQVVNYILHQKKVKPTTIGQGNSVDLTISAQEQGLANALAKCYVGPCELLTAQDTGSQHMFEEARARMTSILVVDVKTGKIEAASSAFTPCYIKNAEGQIDDKCLTTTQAVAKRSWKLENQALYGNEMCGSICKIIESIALFQAKSPLTFNTSNFKEVIKKSKTEKIIDEFMCLDQKFDQACIQKRLNVLIMANNDLKGVSKCEGDLTTCKGLNIIPNAMGVEHSVLPQRLMTAPGKYNQTLLDVFPPGNNQFTLDQIKECYKNGSDERWRKCQGEGLVNTLAELFGQGNARTSPVAVAQSLILLASANQANTLAVKSPKVSILNSKKLELNNDLNPINQRHANQILEALLQPITNGGSAHSACKNVLNQSQKMNCKNDGEWVIASKTGTPLFPHDKYTYSERIAFCKTVQSWPPSSKKNYENSLCNLNPIKWYASLLGRQKNSKIEWTKAIVVMSERNWNETTGKVDSAKEEGTNVSAEIGIRMAKYLVDLNDFSDK